MNSYGEEVPPTTREAGPGNPREGQGTWVAETTMVMLAATVLEGGGTPSDTLDQQHGSLPLPSGGGDFVRHCRAAARWATRLQRSCGRRNQ